MRRGAFGIGAALLAVSAVSAVSAVLGVLAGCAHPPSPSIGVAPQRCGNPCATLNCPSAYTCNVDGNCNARCEPERVGNKPF